MKLIDRKYAENNREEIISAIRSGMVFIYPTDTIYGLGADATNDSAVAKIKEIKKRDGRPLSVIAPGLSWLRENCDIADEEAEEWLKKLPGPYTFFIDLKNKRCVNKRVNLIDDTLGVRIPDHWFAKFVEEAGVPFVTTSVNISGSPHMTDLADLDEGIKNAVDYIIYDGEIRGEPSKKVDLRRK